MKKPEKLEKEVEAILESARDQIQALADEYRAKTLLPFCRRHRLTYLAGNGTFVFYDRKDEPIYRCDLPELEPITDALDIVGVGPNDCFGFYVADITKADISTPKAVTPVRRARRRKAP